MRARIWIAGLVVVTAVGGVLAAVAGESSRSRDPVFRPVGDGKGSYESASATNAEVLRRNIFLDIEIHDTLVYCLQGEFCGDSCASVMILSVADPTAPKFVSRLRFHGGAEGGYRLRLRGDYLYVTVLAPAWTSILHVIDVSDPTRPAVAGSYSFPATAAGIDVSDRYAYVIQGIGSSGDSLNLIHILDVGNPAQITLVHDIPTEYAMSSIHSQGDRTYAVGGFEIIIINTTNPGQSEVMSRLATGLCPGSLDTHDGDSTVFVGDIDPVWPASISALTTLDVTDPLRPEILSQHPLLGMVIDVAVQGEWAFVSNGVCGVQVFNISDPTAPDSVTTYQLPRQAGRLAIQDTLLIVPDIFMVDAENYYCESPSPGPDDPQEGDLIILNIADPARPTLLGFYHPTAEDPTDVDDVSTEQVPAAFAHYQNYPNPFNPGTMIEFDLPKRAEVNLTVYNLLGQEVTRLVQSRSAGHHTIQLNLQDQSSGVYFYELRAGDYSGTGKMLLLK